jgi:outer membrane lipoprotein-sorting protein
MKCTESKELLVAYFEGLLEDSEQQAVEEHLKDCSACQAELQELKGLHDRLVTNGKTLAQSNLEKDVMNQVIREQNVRLKTAARATDALKIRRTFMKSPTIKIAAAAVIIIAVVIGLIPGGNNITFADVVKPILTAKTIIVDVIIGTDDSNPVMHEIIVESKINRTMSNLPSMTMIIDLDDDSMLVLESGDKTAAYVDIQGDVKDRTQNYVNFLRQAIREVQENANIEKLDEQIIDGQKAVGFKGTGPNESVTIWADPETALPIRIEAQIGQEFAFIMKNFEFDAAVDDSLVSMEIPEGYTLQDKSINLSDSTEDDFVESLRIWAEVIGDGTFPDTIGTESAMKAMPTLVLKLTQMQVSEEEGTQLGTSFGKGMLFHQILESQGTWNYAGASVKLGDAATAIFWYQPQGSATYRVIYGDLSVKDVAAENLPE